MHKRCLEKFMKHTKSLTDELLEIKSQIKVKPGSLEEFVKIKGRIKSTEFRKSILLSKRKNFFVQSLIKILDKLRKPYDPTLVWLTLESKFSLEQVDR